MTSDNSGLNITNTLSHEDLRLQARNAVAAYMHHVLFDKTGASPTTMTGAIIHGATEYCLNSAMAIVDKTIAQMGKTV